MQKGKYCIICGQKNNLHKHHIFMGNKQRSIADREGCWVWLCYEHHLGSEGVHNNKELDEGLKKECEYRWLEEHSATIDDFRKVFGKNYV